MMPKKEKLSDIFDGWTHYIVPEEQFISPANRTVVAIEEQDEEDLGLWELGSPEVEYGTVPDPYLQKGVPSPAGRNEEIAWAGLSLALGSLCEIVGGKRKAYQENAYKNGLIVARIYSFKYEPGDDGHQEGRI